LFSFLHIASTRAYPAPMQARRVLSLLMDQGLCAVMLSRNGEIFGPFLCMPMWIAIGSALRYGGRYLYIGSGAGAVFVLAAVVTGEYWQRNPDVAIGLVIAVVFIPVYAHVLAVHLEQARREQQVRADRLEEEAHTDPLTGLPNRRAFVQKIDELFTTPGSTLFSSAVMIVDLDGFKAVNDKGGHGEGDAFLRRTADCLRQCVRADDVIAPLGGDEFAVLVRRVRDDAGVQRIAESIVNGISALPALPGVRVGASIGIVQLPNPRISTPEDAILCADALMYEVKRNGKGAFRLATAGNMPAVVMR
jgi:diguanylate cyclase (GGDEF)-like protein